MIKYLILGLTLALSIPTAEAGPDYPDSKELELIKKKTYEKVLNLIRPIQDSIKNKIENLIDLSTYDAKHKLYEQLCDPRLYSNLMLYRDGASLGLAALEGARLEGARYTKIGNDLLVTGEQLEEKLGKLNREIYGGYSGVTCFFSNYDYYNRDQGIDLNQVGICYIAQIEITLQRIKAVQDRLYSILKPIDIILPPSQTTSPSSFSNEIDNLFLKPSLTPQAKDLFRNPDFLADLLMYNRHHLKTYGRNLLNLLEKHVFKLPESIATLRLAYEPVDTLIDMLIKGASSEYKDYQWVCPPSHEEKFYNNYRNYQNNHIRWQNDAFPKLVEKKARLQKDTQASEKKLLQPVSFTRKDYPVFCSPQNLQKANQWRLLSDQDLEDQEKQAQERISQEKQIIGQQAQEKIVQAQNKLAQEKQAIEQQAQEKIAQEKQAIEKQTQEKIVQAQNKLAQEKQAIEKQAQDKIAYEKHLFEQIAQEKISHEKQLLEQMVKEKLAQEKELLEKMAQLQIQGKLQEQIQEKFFQERQTIEQLQQQIKDVEEKQLQEHRSKKKTTKLFKKTTEQYKELYKSMPPVGEWWMQYYEQRTTIPFENFMLTQLETMIVQKEAELKEESLRLEALKEKEEALRKLSEEEEKNSANSTLQSSMIEEEGLTSNSPPEATSEEDTQVSKKRSASWILDKFIPGTLKKLYK